MENNRTILIIEDDNLLSSMYVTKFTKEGFRVLYSESGEKGIEIIDKEKPDLVLLDIMLPGMDGYDVLRRLKANGRTALIPVIMLSNLSQDADIKKALNLGAVDYIVKAYNIPSEVVEKVKNRLQIT